MLWLTSSHSHDDGDAMSNVLDNLSEMFLNLPENFETSSKENEEYNS